MEKEITKEQQQQSNSLVKTRKQKRQLCAKIKANQEEEKSLRLSRNNGNYVSYWAFIELHNERLKLKAILELATIAI